MRRPTCQLCQQQESRTALSDGHGRRIPICLSCEEKLLTLFEESLFEEEGDEDE